MKRNVRRTFFVFEALSVFHPGSEAPEREEGAYGGPPWLPLKIKVGDFTGIVFFGFWVLMLKIKREMGRALRWK